MGEIGQVTVSLMIIAVAIIVFGMETKSYFKRRRKRKRKQEQNSGSSPFLETYKIKNFNLFGRTWIIGRSMTKEEIINDEIKKGTNYGK